jgi:hypothetical protein
MSDINILVAESLNEGFLDNIKSKFNPKPATPEHKGSHGKMELVGARCCTPDGRRFGGKFIER